MFGAAIAGVNAAEVLAGGRFGVAFSAPALRYPSFLQVR